MTELYLNFTDEKGEEKRILVEGEKFVAGRHSENDLSIANSKLSRQHIKIERFADIFVISDMNSSNGTLLNDVELIDPKSLNNGDKLNLGGGLEIEVELISDDPYAQNGSANASEDGGNSIDNADIGSSSNGISIGASANTAVSTPQSSGSGLGLFFILAPLMGLAILLLLGGGLYFFSDRGGTEVAQNGDSDFIYTSSEDDKFLDDLPSDLSSEEDTNSESNTVETNSTQTDNPSDTPKNDVSENPTETKENPTGTVDPPTNIETVSTPKEVSETDKIRVPALNLMRLIARNDPKPILTTKQLSVINSKIKQYQGSGALAANINDARSNASQIASLANSKNIKPQFLANAALTKLGNQRGNVVATAQGMLDTLQNLTISIGNEFANENLLIIAAYNQGVAGENLKMRDKLASLTKNNPDVSSRQVRTIWFLHDKQEISDAEFELALRFLAIGTITQNPKAFNVNTEALVLN